MLRARPDPRPSRPGAALVVALALVSACTENSSFFVRWQLGRSEDSVEILRSVDQCTELGISRIRVTTRDAAATIVDERDFSCFPAGFEDTDAVAPGPAVGAGTYTVTLTAISRLGVPFTADDAGGSSSGGGGGSDTGATTTSGSGSDPADEKVIAFDAKEIVIAETGQGTRVTDFRIVGVAECDDGIDNDLDGYTDLSDPSCRGSRVADEQSDIATAQITIRPHLLGDNPNATCSGLGLRSIDLELAGPTPLAQRITCTTTSQTFSDDLAPGDYTLSITGVGFDDATRAVIPLDPKVAAFNLAPSGFRSVDVDADFSIPTFLAPIDAGFSFSIEYQAADDALPLTSCSPVADGLVLDQVRITIVDQDGAPVPSAAVLADPDPPILLDGATLPCTDLLKVRSVAPLVWDDTPGNYSALGVVVEAFPAGSNTPCYGNADAPTPAAPNASFSIRVPRLSAAGACAD